MKLSVDHSAETIDSDSTRKRIVSAARVHFFSSGFRGVTMDDLAEELGMSKKTLYVRFPAKIALVEAVLEEKFFDVNAEMQEVMNREGDFLETLHEMLRVMLHHLDEIKPPFVRDMRKEGPEVFGKIEARRNEAFAYYFGRLLAQGRKAGLIRRDIPVHLLVEVLLSAIRSIVNPTKLGELRITPKEAISAIVTVVLEGALTGSSRSISSSNSV